MRRTGQMETAARGIRGVCLPCRCGCVAEFPLQMPQGSLTSTTFCEVTALPPWPERTVLPA
eukprot:5381401-Pleurochrysis_carterae.AAC.1